jgi:membrane-bound lytic murein transglycosylase B
MTAIILAMTGGSISAVFAASVKTQSAPVAATNPVNPYAGYITEASRRFSIPENWIRAVMRVESREDVRAVSPKGAIGLMQIMPDTWAGLRLRYRLGRNPRDPRDNILAGAAYLREMYDRYGAAGFSRRLQRRPRPLSRVCFDRPAAAPGNPRLCRSPRVVAWR